MFDIRKSALRKYTRTHWNVTNEDITGPNNQTSNGAVEVKNNTPDTDFQNAKAGEIFNLLENMVLNSTWDIRDNKNGSSILLGRSHMFYKENQDEKEKIDSLLEKEKIYFDLFNNPLGLFNKSSKTLVENGINNSFDQTTETLLKNDNTPKKTEYIKEILDRDHIRKVSELHFAINGFNLIHAEIKVNEEVFNTISYNYEEERGITDIFSGDKSVIVSLVPESNTLHLSEVSFPPPHYITSFLEDKKNINRNIEFFENMLLKNLENSYTGKIFTKFNDEIELGDIIVLIDNINSLNGIFRIETFEHRFTKDGLITVLNVKAYVTLNDPELDVYSNSILANLHKQLKEEEVEDNIVFGNIFSNIAKVMYQIPKYAMFYHKDDKAYSDNHYPIKDKNIRTNALPIKFHPMIKKGRMYLPKNIEHCFYCTEIENQSYISALLKNISNSVIGLFQDGSEYAIGTVRYTLDFLISIPTFGLHEFLKPLLGFQYKKMMDIFDNRNFTNNQIDLMKDNENFYIKDEEGFNTKNYFNQEKNSEYTVSFFNMKAQQEKNLFHFKNEKSMETVDISILNKKIQHKMGVSKAIVENSCDTMFSVEVYDGFKIPRLNYTYEDYIAGVFGKTYEKFELFENKYGKEFGIIYSKNNDKFNSYFAKDSYTIEIEPGRQAVVSTMYVKEFNYFYRGKVDLLSGTGFSGTYSLTEIKFIWFHNYYGSSPDSIEKRKKIFYNILNSAKEMINDSVGVIIIGDFNLHIDNDRYTINTPAVSTNQSVIITKEKDRFVSCIDKPTTLSSTTANKFVNKFDNILISDNLDYFHEEGLIKTNINKYYLPTGVDRRDISDHLPIYVSFKKMNDY